MLTEYQICDICDNVSLAGAAYLFARRNEEADVESQPETLEKLAQETVTICEEDEGKDIPPIIGYRFADESYVVWDAGDDYLVFRVFNTRGEYEEYVSELEVK